MNGENPAINYETLQQWLTEKREVIVLDIRKAVDRAEWSIPGSIHVDAYDALKADDPNALANLDLPKDIPVVTVCGVGKTACVAARHLKARGIDAISLDGGMKDWSRAWNTADITLSDAPVQIVQFRRTGKGCLSYLIASGHSALVLDPSLNPQVYIYVAKSRGWEITHVLESHTHADHLSRGRPTAQSVGVELLLPKNSKALYPFIPIKDGDRIMVGSLMIKAIHTPGHTDESTSYLIEGTNELNNRFLFTGDTLFVNGVGRPDLSAKVGNIPDHAVRLYRSLQRLLSLEPNTLILPGHHGKPIAFDGKPIAITLGELKANLPLLAKSESAFVDWIIERISTMPADYLQIVQHNEDGTFPVGNPNDLEAGGNRCAVS